MKSKRSEFFFQLLAFVVRGYQLVISPFFHALSGPGMGCRHHPSCSQNLLQSVEKHGFWRGGKKGLIQLLNCHPWGRHAERTQDR